MFVFRMLDWDDKRRLRIFSFAPVAGAFADWKDPSQADDHMHTWGPKANEEFVAWTEGVMEDAPEGEYLVASHDLLGTIDVWSPTELKQIGKESWFEVGPSLGIDWFKHLGCMRTPENT